MNLVARIFNYPTKNLAISFFALIGFSLSVLIDKGQIEDGFFLSCVVNFCLFNALFLCEDVMSIFTQAQNGQTRSMIHLKMSKLRRNIIFGICMFLIFSYFYYNFSDYYEAIHYSNTIDFVLDAFAVGGFFIALRAWNEQRRRLKPAQSA